MPTPGQNETQDEFISRCIPIVLDEGTAENPEQAAAVCFSLWENRGNKEMEYAYSLLETKDIHEDDEYIRIKGIASTPTPDRSKDIVEPMGAKFTTPMPLIWMHNHEKPVGHVTFAKPNKNGIPFEAEIPKVKEAGKLKERVDEAIHSLKYKLVAAVSIGFRSDKFEFMDNGGVNFKEWEWLELSLVTIPANPEAKIEVVKSIDRQIMAASGKRNVDQIEKTSGDSVKRRRPIQLIPRKRT